MVEIIVKCVQHPIPARKTGKVNTTVQKSDQESVPTERQAVSDGIMQLDVRKECRSGIGAETLGLSESKRGVDQVSNKQLCDVPEILTRKSLGEMSHPGETLIASNTSKYKRSDKSCDEKDFQQGKFHEMLSMRHIGSHHMHLNEFHAEHCYYFKVRISRIE